MKSIPLNPGKATACIIHCRVSTSKQAHEGESLDVQEAVCKQIALDKGWHLLHDPWKESFSGRKNQRPVFDEVLNFLDEHRGEVGYYICRSIDRFTRGGSFTYEQMKRALGKRGVEIVDSYGIIQPARNTLADLGFEYEWSRSSPSEIAEIVVATSAKHEVTNILTRLIGQEIRLRRRGYKVRGPADGFVNARVYVDGRKRTIEEPDPERAKFFVAMFELRASGRYTDQEICERVNALGYRTKGKYRWDALHQNIVGRTGGKPLIPKRLQEIIQRPIYCGVICEKWTDWKPIRAAYPGLVSIETFNAANEGKVFIRETASALEIVRSGERKRLSKHNPLFPFRHVILCPNCRRPLLGSSPRGSTGVHYPTYHCARGHTHFGVKKETLHAKLESFVGGLRFHPEALGAIRTALLSRYQTRRAEVLGVAAMVGSNVAELEMRLAQCVSAFQAATSDLMRRSLEKQAEDLAKQIESGRHVRDRLEINELDIQGFLRDAKSIMERPSILLNSPANAEENRALYSLFFEELPTYHEIVDGTAKLRWIFYLCRDFETPESALVRLSGFKWNLIEDTVIGWKKFITNFPSALVHGSADGRAA